LALTLLALNVAVTAGTLKKRLEGYFTSLAG